MAESTIIHLAADLSHIHTDYLWRSKGCWEGYPYYGAPDLYEDCARLASRGVRHVTPENNANAGRT